MVRRLPLAGFVARYENGWHCDTGDVDCEGSDTPEEALRPAGVTVEENPVEPTDFNQGYVDTQFPIMAEGAEK